MSAVYAMLREAVVKKRVVAATYNGHKRVMCPHVLGRNRQGREQALFYQFAGGSSRPLGGPGSPAHR